MATSADVKLRLENHIRIVSGVEFPGNLINSFNKAKTELEKGHVIIWVNLDLSYDPAILPFLDATVYPDNHRKVDWSTMTSFDDIVLVMDNQHGIEHDGYYDQFI